MYPARVLHWIDDREIESSSGATFEKRSPIDDGVLTMVVRGNGAVVAKSHEQTPFTAVAFGRLLKDAGLPSGLYGAVQGLGPEVGQALVQDPRVGIVSFTGSAPTGKLIQKTVSERPVLAKVCLEL